MKNAILAKISELLQPFVQVDIDFSQPPNPAMGDIAIHCFTLAKEWKMNPAEAAKVLQQKLEAVHSPFIASMQTAGPYVNLTLHSGKIAELVLSDIQKNAAAYGEHNLGEQKKILVEYACPNPLKAFHLGHLKNLITGEAVVRVFENAGYNVMRVNYQGDVGMHVAKALWGIYDWISEFEKTKTKSLRERVEFLGKAYAHGAEHFELGDVAKQEVIEYNDKVYARDPSIQDVYQTARTWSLEYFDTIYKRLGSHFDRLFFESEMYERGTEIVHEFLRKRIFKESEGAIIFEGSKHGLHDRVFINSKGFPTYEAKDLALAEQHLQYQPDSIIHVVGKEQTEYFKVVFKALEHVFPETVGKEIHLPGGFLQLKSGKMSSRKGNIVTGDSLLEAVKEEIEEIMKDRDLPDKEAVVEHVTAAALKYAMLKADVTQDVAFDMEESVSTSGDSGPYLLYIGARIRSILKKVGVENEKIRGSVAEEITNEEKQLLLRLAEFPDVTKKAAAEYDPSVVAKYLFTLAQTFNTFYTACPVAQAEADIQRFRLTLIQAVLQVLDKGLWILGIEPVEEM